MLEAQFKGVQAVEEGKRGKGKREGIAKGTIKLVAIWRIAKDELETARGQGNTRKGTKEGRREGLNNGRLVVLVVRVIANCELRAGGSWRGEECEGSSNVVTLRREAASG
ncbi:hypothetical protein E2C01_023144 [Portunus trituberculatus]|uniref:Uncharacterized protein n=1 Tax=Portunus trituberculatus TaxID=210409 RepID=A0A5B7E787_PORTR|nr:hypothetical protein [Portunus trituberculatus]